MKKGCLIGIIAAVVLAGLVATLVAVIFLFTGGGTEAANKFLKQVGQGQTAEAYQSTAAAFRREQSLDQFTGVVRQLGLDHYKSASWSNRKRDNDESSVEGTAKMTDGSEIPLTINLVKEDGAWKVLSLRSPKAGASTSTPADADIPGDAEMKVLVKNSILDLDQAVQSQDFTQFYSRISNTWQQQVTADQLKQKFQSFIDKDVKMHGVNDVVPVFDAAPKLNSDQVLVVSGHYPTHPMIVKFTVKYVREIGVWKLIGIYVDLEKPDAGPAQ